MSRLALPCVGMETHCPADASQPPIVTAAHRTRHEPPGYRAFKALIAQIHGAVAAALLTPNAARGGKRLVAEKQQSMSTPAAVLLPGNRHRYPHR